MTNPTPTPDAPAPDLLHVLEMVQDVLAENRFVGDNNPFGIRDLVGAAVSRGQSALRFERTEAQSVAGLRDRLTEQLHSEFVSVYDCGRVWEAWSIGTMTERDFSPLHDRLDEIVDGLMTIIEGHAEALRAERDEAQPVAWQIRPRGAEKWSNNTAPWPVNDEFDESRPLYAHPPATSPGADQNALTPAEQWRALAALRRQRERDAATSSGAAGDAPTVTTWRSAVEGLLAEWDKLTRYGSPMAKQANEAVAFARRLMETPYPKAPAAAEGDRVRALADENAKLKNLLFRISEVTQEGASYKLAMDGLMPDLLAALRSAQP